MNQEKIKTTLYFPSIVELIEFEQGIGLIGHQVDNINTAIVGSFTANELKLAQQDFGAALTKEDVPDNERYR